MKQTKWIRTTEDWYPTVPGNAVYPNPAYCNPLPDPAVRVSMMRLTTGEWRVCVWGGDDFGLEIDLPAGHMHEAEHLYENVVDFTTQQQLKDWGFHHA